jgi:hypothetical protein
MFVLENPIRLAGLTERLYDAYDRRRFTAADLLYALYELERELLRVRSLDMPTECVTLIDAAQAGVNQRRAGLLADADDAVRRQVKVLAREDAAA